MSFWNEPKTRNLEAPRSGFVLYHAHVQPLKYVHFMETDPSQVDTILSILVAMTMLLPTEHDICLRLLSVRAIPPTSQNSVLF